MKESSYYLMGLGSCFVWGVLFLVGFLYSDSNSWKHDVFRLFLGLTILGAIELFILLCVNRIRNRLGYKESNIGD